jgi:methylmalonyl-CoA carboxyltransferase 5S subunit
MTGEFADLMLGYYGETIGPRDRTVVELAFKQTGKNPINGRPADLLKPEWHELRDATVALAGSNGSDEDVLTYAMFPKVAPKFFTTRAQGPKNLGKDPNAPPAAAAQAPAKAPVAESGKGPVRTTITYDVKCNGKSHKVTVSPVQ